MAPAPAVTAVHLELPYPVEACDFDPHNANRLVVGGGGGIGYRISVLDVDDAPSKLSVACELKLAVDGLTTLAVGGQASGSGADGGSAALVYAGIIATAAEIRQAGKNEHFRVFSIDQKSKAKAASGAAPKITELSRTPLLTSGDPDSYQRRLRIPPASPPHSRQLGAAATGAIGVAKEPQLVVFELPGSGATAPKVRRMIGLAKEAEDLDVMQVAEDHWKVVYCDKLDLHLAAISTAKGAGAENSPPAKIFSLPTDDPARPMFRSVRFLTPNFVLAIANSARRKGVFLYGIRLPPGGQTQQNTTAGVSNPTASLALSTRLPKHVVRAVDLAVRNLTPPTTAPGPTTSRPGNTQFAVAVTGQDESITLYTLDYKAVADVDLLLTPRLVKTLRKVHPDGILSLAFSCLPAAAPSSAATNSSSHRPMLRLASTSVTGHCVVHTIPLRKVTEKPAHSRGPPRAPRYVVALPTSALSSPGGLLVLLALVVGLLGVLLQGALEISGLTRPLIGARHLTPASWHGAGPAARSSSPVPEILARYLPETMKLGPDDKIVVHSPPLDGESGAESPIVVDRHDAARDADARGWEELTLRQKEAWKAKLKAAGHWAESMGEEVLKGVLFGELAGVVRAAVE